METTGETIIKDLQHPTPVLAELFQATEMLIKEEQKNHQYKNLIDLLINFFSHIHPEAEWWLTYRRAGYITTLQEGYIIPESTEKSPEE